MGELICLNSRRFDPMLWIRQAIAAGLDPFAWLPGEGGRYLRTRERGVDRALEPRQLSAAERIAVVEALILAGRWAGQHAEGGPPLAGPGAWGMR